MRLVRDRRSIEQQIKSGVQIAAATLATLAVTALGAFAYLQVTAGDGTHHVLVGWLLIGTLVVVLATTVQFWCRWFHFLPGFVALRSGGLLLLGWFLPRGYILFVFVILIALMAALAYRFSKLTRMVVTDRIVLLLALACFFGSVAGAWSKEPRISALVLSGFGDLVLWLQWDVIRKPRVRMRQREVQTGTVVSTSDH